jgi:hypothetical protein
VPQWQGQLADGKRIILGFIGVALAGVKIICDINY